MRTGAQSRAKGSVPSLTPVLSGLLQRKCACGGAPGADGECAECREKKLQRKAASNDQTPRVPPIVHDVLRSPGQPLDPTTKGLLELRFGHDFSQVRIHSDARAAKTASVIGARAYTVNRDIVFGASEYAPQTESGCRLLSHELTHVVQQRAGVHIRGGVGQAGDAYERQADAVANQVVNGQSAEGILESVAGKSGAVPVQRKATGAIQLQPVQSKPTNSKIGNQPSNVETREDEPVTLAEVTVTAEGPKNAEEIIKRIGILQDKLSSVSSRQQAKPVVEAIKELLIDLESAPISPTPKRDFVAGPIKFGEFGPYFYDFGFESMQDKHWREGWTAIYKLAAGPFGIAIDLCELFLGPAEEREEVAKGILTDEAVDQIAEKGKDVGSYMLRKGVTKGLAKGVAISIKSLAEVIEVATTAYELYKANTEGPSPHAAAVETAALIMATVYGDSDGRDGTIRHGGFIPTPTTSYCRVARQQVGPFPQLKDRRLAFDLMGNRIYERMRDLIAPKHIATPEAFYAFRKARIDNAWNIAEAAGGDLMGRKTTLVQGKEEQLEKMEELAEWLKTQPKVDVTNPLKLSPPTMPSDQYSGIERTIKQRHEGLRP